MNDQHLILESARRSRIRVDAVIVTDGRGPLSLAMIAELCGVSERTIQWAFDGHLPYYRPELSPVARGLLVELPATHGRAFEVTSKGREWARRWRIERRDTARGILEGREPIRGAASLRYRGPPG